MLNTKIIEKLASYIHEYIPKITSEIKSNLDSKIKKILKNQLIQMNLINRDEFDTYVSILLDIQEKIDTLEKKIKELELKHQINTDYQIKNNTQYNDQLNNIKD